MITIIQIQSMLKIRIVMASANIAMLMDVMEFSRGGRSANWKTSRWKLRSCLSCQIALDTH